MLAESAESRNIVGTEFVEDGAVATFVCGSTCTDARDGEMVTRWCEENVPVASYAELAGEKKHRLNPVSI
jgi:hypothetical protein